MQPILKIDLSSRSIAPYKIPEAWEEAFLGGASLAARLLYADLTPALDPLSPEAPLLFLNGPLSGTAGPTVGRFVVCGKGPATGLWAESNCGGFWGYELRSCGFDGLWITGRASEPLYLWLRDEHLEFRPAANLWGRDIYDTQDLVKQEIVQKGAHVAVIGPAAENGVLFAGIYCDHGRAAGRTGLGAVMASKNLKAIAVRGSHPIPLADAAAYAPLRSESNRALKQDNEARALHELGTAGAANYSEYIGAMPARYFHQGSFEPVDNVSGATMSETILAGTSACHACVIACGRVVRLEDGAKRKGPEYETICGFGPNLLISDLPTIVRLGELCDRYGMDTISAANTIGLVFHLYERGDITSGDTGGLSLHWGDADAVSHLLDLTARGDGLGKWIGQGSRRLGAHFGVEEEAVQVNGLEVAFHDPRALSGMALSYATSPRGACHNQSDYFFVDWGHTQSEIGIEYFSRHSGAEKSANVARHQDWRTVYNSLVMCIFGNVTPQMQVALIDAACGYDWTVEDMLRCGERGWNIKRLINNRLGLSGADDRLPKALMEPYPDGGSAGFVPDLQGMLYTYYEARGWDQQTGYPTRKKLHELGLDDLAGDIWDRPGDEPVGDSYGE
jgi:aldehyde:ferredoxin oxidoreductase